MRLALSLVAGAASAAFGALILGEYQLTGITGVIAGGLFGLAIAELVLTAGGPSVAPNLVMAMIGVALFSAAGLAWAAWISAGHDWGYVPNGAYLGLVAAAGLGPWWLRGGVRRAARPSSPD